MKHLTFGILGLLTVNMLAYADNAPRGLYLTGQISNSWANSSGETLSDIDHSGINVSANIKKDMGIGGRLGLGFAFNRFIALESGYAFLPNFTIQANTTNVNPQVSASGKVDMSALDILGRISIPIDKFFVYAKGGAAYVMLDANNQITLNAAGVSTTVSIPIPSNDKSYNTWRPEAVVGVGYAFTPHMTADVSYGRIFGLGSIIKSEHYAPDVDTAALGLSYYF